MKEILGGSLDLAFKELNISAIKTYEGDTYLDNKTQIWELTEEDFEMICNLEEKDWKDNWGWWRSATGSNQGGVNAEKIINGKKILAWDESENRKSDYGEDFEYDNEYESLLSYFDWEIGVGQPRNICALAVDLAKQNGMTLGELFQKYQG